MNSNQGHSSGGEKRLFMVIFMLLAVSLLLLPFMVTFNDLLTRVVERNILYAWIQENIVPVEALVMGRILLYLGYSFAFSPIKSAIIVNQQTLVITWNCIGWQSMLLFLLTLIIGFRGRYQMSSILEAMLIGVLGTFWINIGRMLFTVLLFVHAPAIFRIVFHDYLAAIVTIIWLFFFWWFSYSYVLEEKK